MVSLERKKILKHLVCDQRVCVLSRFSGVWLFVTQRTMACQAPLSMGILQTRVLEWDAMPFSRWSSQTKGRTRISYVSCIVWQIIYQ